MKNVVGEEKNYIDNIITALFSSAKFKKVAEVYVIVILTPSLKKELKRNLSFYLKSRSVPRSF